MAERQYCKHCHALLTRDALRRHLPLCEADRPYICELPRGREECGKRFKQLKGLEIHKGKDHNAEEKNSTYRCRTCAFGTEIQSSLQAHEARCRSGGFKNRSRSREPSIVRDSVAQHGRDRRSRSRTADAAAPLNQSKRSTSRVQSPKRKRRDTDEDDEEYQPQPIRAGPRQQLNSDMAHLQDIIQNGMYQLRLLEPSEAYAEMREQKKTVDQLVDRISEINQALRKLADDAGCPCGVEDLVQENIDEYRRKFMSGKSSSDEDEDGEEEEQQESGSTPAGAEQRRSGRCESDEEEENEIEY